MDNDSRMPRKIHQQLPIGTRQLYFSWAGRHHELTDRFPLVDER